MLLLSDTGQAAINCRAALDSAPVCCFMQFSFWTAPRVLLQCYQDWMRDRPQDRLVLLINDRATYKAVRQLSVPALLVTTSAFLDFEIPHICDVPKCCRAIYVARLAQMKRHALAAKSRQTLFIGAADSCWADTGWQRQLREICPLAVFRDVVPPLELPEVICSAYSGLILSAVEGASRVAAEYQLCGLPVVTTREQGGRLEYLAPAFTSVVDDTADAVEDAVAFWHTNPPNPYIVRTAVLRTLRQHRQRFVAAVQEQLDIAQAGINFPRPWQHGMLFSRQLWDARDSTKVEDYKDTDVLE